MDEEKLELQKVLARMLFKTPDEAAVYALNKITEPSYELGGVVFKDKAGLYSPSEAAGNKRTGKFEAEVRIPKGSTPVAIFHTHPGYGDEAALAENFSGDDIKVADQMRMLSYIRAMNSGNIKKYEPGKTPIDTAGIGLRKTKQSRGDLIFAKAQ